MGQIFSHFAESNKEHVKKGRIISRKNTGGYSHSNKLRKITRIGFGTSKKIKTTSI
ncbi:hypothetical protein [Sessilibacter corallicola]|uniref:hypothetical protein n=1 Tax=Sessilibacter corallicola TaxID=2904075 RepID=UPI001E2F8F4B|nr:hypothetical protein [Sessilibacter corallicola]MCE2026819.1 hypothetical protein [Sessilibacter corallicola]